MRAAELRMEDLLEMPSTGGVLRFAGERALLLDAVALGLLRAQLVQTFGTSVARGLLTRLGYAHGQRTAVAMRSAVAWSDDDEWRIAGGRLHQLHGLVSFEPVEPAQRLAPGAVAEAIWRDSYEAEQHTLHMGRSTQCVCWTLAGFASGYLSHVLGEEVISVEERCVGRGDAVCHMVGRFAREWGERLEQLRAPFERDCLDASLRDLQRTLMRLEAQVRDTRGSLARDSDDAEAEAHGIVARSAQMRRVLLLASRAAKVDATVLVQGESGVGKELIARYLHDASTRCGGPFVAVDCGALPETLLESELFGHARGAFTGATHARAGLFEAAHGGTLFLDEVGEIPLSLQSRLLRVLQEREVRRLGENLPRRFDVRVVAATNRPLDQWVAEGRFREDLYYRLRVVEIEIPALRDRPDDILPIARAALTEAAERMGRDVRGLAPDAARALVGHGWPGNVRELRNAIERALVFAQGSNVTAADLPALAAPAPSSAGAPSSGTLAQVERAHIERVLASVGGHRGRAAASLGIGEATLFRRLRAYRADTES